MKKKDSPLPARKETEQKEILQKLCTLEELLKKKDDKPLTFKEACAYLGYAPSYLYKLTYRKVIPHYKPTGKMIFFSKNELDEWIYSSAERRVQNAELKSEKNFEKDPNQENLFEQPQDEKPAKETAGKREKGKGKSKKEEVWIEFPLKSRRRKEL